MDTNVRRRRLHKEIIVNTSNSYYTHDVSMFLEPPSFEIALQEFQELAIERLQLLRIIEQASLKGHKMFSEDWKQCIKEDLNKEGLKKYVRLLNGVEGNSEADILARRADHISHYILQLAYCRSDDLRRWFLFREVEWFKLKFLSQSPKSITHFLKINNLVYSPISPEEKEHYKRELIASTPLLKDVSCETTDFYKVPFTEVAPLVKTRRVYLRKGYAYIQMSDLVVCIQAKFRAALSERLNIFSHRLPTMDDDRLNSLLRNLHSAETGRNYAIREDKDAVDPALLDEYSKKHYPLCMRHMHEALRSIHKLKHWGRLQYGLFLKGIGLLYEDAMNFWQQEFTKIMDSNHFQKNYTYNVKHNYGKVGNRVNYTPCSCMKIITQNVGPGDYHGCPFKHWNPAMLKQKILEYGISTEGAQAVMELVSNGHYQIACSKYFEYAHGTAPANFINHPNQYFDESMNLTKEKQSKKP